MESKEKVKTVEKVPEIKSRKKTGRKTGPFNNMTKNGLLRILFYLALVLLQVWFLVSLVASLAKKVPWLSTAITYTAIVVILSVYSRKEDASFKLLWIILIAAVPFVGVVSYILVDSQDVHRGMNRRFTTAIKRYRCLIPQDEKVIRQLDGEDPYAAQNAHYIESRGGYPLYHDSAITYYEDPVQALQDQIEAAKSARHFIFLEYLAVEDGESITELKDVLIRKAHEGVTVRMIYDDLGSFTMLSDHFARAMRKEGIDCQVFNPAIPFLRYFMNFRDHRKLFIVDNKVGFTGGYNLADRYFHNETVYGWWKDTGVRLEGPAVRNMTAMFLSTWDVLDKEQWRKHSKKATHVDGRKFFEEPLGEDPLPQYADGFVQPYADSPLDKEDVGYQVYMNIIRSARKYVWFVTPYLVLTDQLADELISAAKRGLDVRIITPGIPDKKIIYQLTRSYYKNLLEGGVRIFEYTPGFCHAKMCLSDGRVGVVGSINLDFRSLFFHFEDAVFMAGGAVLDDLYDDCTAMFRVSKEVDVETVNHRPVPVRIFQLLVRLLAPLL